MKTACIIHPLANKRRHQFQITSQCPFSKIRNQDRRWCVYIQTHISQGS